METIEYVRRRYHPENVAQIVTFGTLASRAVIKDVGRVMSVPYSDTDRVTKLMDGNSTIRELLGLNIENCRKKVADTENDPDKHDEALKKLADQEGKRNPEFIEIYESDDQLKRVIDMGLKLEGMPRNTSMHAAGVVIRRKKIADNVPLSRNGEDITTQFDMKEVESIGMLKMTSSHSRPSPISKKRSTTLKRTQAGRSPSDRSATTRAPISSFLRQIQTPCSSSNKAA